MDFVLAACVRQPMKELLTAIQLKLIKGNLKIEAGKNLSQVVLSQMCLERERITAIA